VVTASKRGASSAQDLAMSISAIGGETLEAMGAVEFTDFSRSVAGLDVVDVGPGQKRYMVRGLNLPGESTVGLYYDNIRQTLTCSILSASKCCVDRREPSMAPILSAA
jgi:outer membrane receptor protein involved in Fe transport